MKTSCWGGAGSILYDVALRISARQQSKDSIHCKGHRRIRLDNAGGLIDADNGNRVSSRCRPAYGGSSRGGAASPTAPCDCSDTYGEEKNSKNHSPTLAASRNSEEQKANTNGCATPQEQVFSW